MALRSGPPARAYGLLLKGPPARAYLFFSGPPARAYGLLLNKNKTRPYQDRFGAWRGRISRAAQGGLGVQRMTPFDRLYRQHGNRGGRSAAHGKTFPHRSAAVEQFLRSSGPTSGIEVGSAALETGLSEIDWTPARVEPKAGVAECKSGGR